jgi:uncharacterized membrane protein
MNLLQRMGWRPGEGLGKNNKGSLQPLLMNVKLDKRGLISQEERKMVIKFYNFFQIFLIVFMFFFCFCSFSRLGSTTKKESKDTSVGGRRKTSNFDFM